MPPKGKFQLPSVITESVALEMEIPPFLPSDNVINDDSSVPDSETMAVFAEWNDQLSLLLRTNLVSFFATLAFRASIPTFLDSFLRYSQRPTQSSTYHALHKFALHPFFSHFYSLPYQQNAPFTCFFCLC